MQSGLYDKLTSKGLMVSHEELERNGNGISILPRQVPFISYPYEWAFHSLKTAALTTLEINKLALEHNMILKDANGYNIQFVQGAGRWQLIDTASFMDYEDGKPWNAYGQFIRHFLAPLVLAYYHGGEHIRSLIYNLDGLSPAKTAMILPLKSYFSAQCLMYLHAYRATKNDKRHYKVSRDSLKGILHNLYNYIESLNYKPRSSWSKYTSATAYVWNKKRMVIGYLNNFKNGNGTGQTKTLCDLGANTGEYSLLAARAGMNVTAIDSDHDCIEMMPWHTNILPLVVDINNPTPAIGWRNEERKSFLERADFDYVLALALIHHMCVSNNMSLEKIAEFFRKITKDKLIVEFVPYDDPRFQYIARGKTFPVYSQQVFESAFGRYFRLIGKETILGSCRTLYVYSVS